VIDQCSFLSMDRIKSREVKYISYVVQSFSTFRFIPVVVYFVRICMDIRKNCEKKDSFQFRYYFVNEIKTVVKAKTINSLQRSLFFYLLTNLMRIKFILLHLSLQPSAGYGLLVARGFLITHDAPQSVGLLWTSDQLVAETSTWQHTTDTTEKHPFPGGIRTHDRSRPVAVDLRPRPLGHWDRPWEQNRFYFNFKIASSRLSFRSHGTTRFPLEGFSWNFIFGHFYENLSRKYNVH
jgi:hypothetical protein